MPSRVFVFLLVIMLAACAKDDPVRTHSFMRADGSGLDERYQRVDIAVPNWQREYPFCEYGWSVGYSVSHGGRCSYQEATASVEVGSGEPLWWEELPPRMSDRHLKRLMRWRNRFGRPFSMFVLGPDHSREAKYKYSIRLAFGHILAAGPILRAWANTFGSNYRFGGDVSLIEWQTKAWAVRNLSEYAARDWDYFVAEMFAWYTAPWYEKGSLPGEVEEQLEEMANFDWNAKWEYLRPDARGNRLALVDLPGLDQMKAALARAREAEPCDCYVDKPFMAHDELTFLYIWRWEHRFDSPWVTYDPNAVPFCEYPKRNYSYERGCEDD